MVHATYKFVVIIILMLFGVSWCIDVGCDLFQGSWIFDDATPLYNVSMCSFIEKQFDCIGNGRPDNLYLKYRWKPTACELPRFNGQDFLRRNKGKKIMVVGDSLSLNQWQSLTCMLHASVPQSKFTLTKIGNLSTFYMQEYNISLMLSRNAFLVDLVIEKKGRILKLDSIENGNSWKGYDMLIFNTWHWWLHKGSQKPGAEWINTSKGATCNGETQPISGSVYPGEVPPAVAVVKSVLSNMTAAVRLLDVTTLSQLRKDGHPSIYGIGGRTGNDCSHWCLAGVTDTWNQLFYLILVTNSKSRI